MTKRDTSTGKMLEAMILPALQRGGYTCKRNANIGQRLGGGKHMVDVLAKDEENGEYLISAKWQEVSGTAEQKVPFEVICLADAILNSEGKYKKAFLILGGKGWKLRKFYIGGGLKKHLTYGDLVTIMDLEDFVATAGRKEL